MLLTTTPWNYLAKSDYFGSSAAFFFPPALHHLPSIESAINSSIVVFPGLKQSHGDPIQISHSPGLYSLCFHWSTVYDRYTFFDFIAA